MRSTGKNSRHCSELNQPGWQQLAKGTSQQSNQAHNKNMEFIFMLLSLQRDPSDTRLLEKDRDHSGMSPTIAVFPNWEKQPRKNHAAWYETPSGQLQQQIFEVSEIILNF